MAATKAKNPTTKKKQLKAGKKKPINKWLILGGVAVVAVIGVAVVRFSSASSITFLRGVDQMAWSENLSSTAYKPESFYRGIYRYASVGRGVVGTVVSKEDLRYSNYACAKVVNSSSSKVKVWFTHRRADSGEINAQVIYMKPGELKDLCVYVASRNKYGSRLTVLGDRSGLGVRGFYGLKK